MISRLRVRNFKSIGDRGIDIELRPLTIFIGPNGSGKSSILQAIDWLAMKSELPEITNLSDYDRRVYRIEVFKDLVHGRRPVEWFEIEVSMRLRNEDIERLTPYLKAVEWRALNLKEPRLNIVSYRVAFKPETKEVEQNLSLNGEVIAGFIKGHDITKGRYIATYTAPPALTDESPPSLTGHEEMILYKESFHLLHQKNDALGRFCEELTLTLRDYFSHAYFISALRGSIDYRGSIEKLRDEIKVGKLGENVIEILGLTIGASDERRRGIGDRVMFWSSNIGLGRLLGGIGIGPAIRSTYTDPQLKAELETSLASHGSKQVLAFITQLFYATSDSTIMIEEPEISLHPGYQVRLPLLFADAVNEGKQILVTTHSTLLMLGLSHAIHGEMVEGWTSKGMVKREIRLNKEDVAIYHVVRGKDGCTEVEKLKLTDEGLVKGGVPSFIEVEHELYNRLFRRALVE